MFRSINGSDSIQLDRSTETALLWSSGGVKSILLNQWKSTMNENESVLINTFTGKNSFLLLLIILIYLDIATLRCSLSQALRLYVYPYFRPSEVDPNTAVTSKDAKTKGNTTSLKKARSPSPKSKQQRQPSAIPETNKKKKSTSTLPVENISEKDSASEPPIEERQRPALQLQQLNTVIFGLPNLTFTP